MIEAERAGAAIAARVGEQSRSGLHGRAEFERSTGWVGRVERAVLMLDLDPRGRKAADGEMRLEEIEVFLRSDPEAETLHRRLAPFQHEAMMAGLLHSPQPQRLAVLVAHDQAQRVAIKRAARGEVADARHQMARPGDVERRLVDRGR